MSKKHFVALAQSIARITDTNAREQAAKAVSAACKQFNPLFDEQCFIEACNKA
jgi:hypothetical protein